MSLKENPRTSEFEEIHAFSEGKLSIADIAKETIVKDSDLEQLISIINSQSLQRDSALGSFKSYRRAGKSFFKINHRLGFEGSQILDNIFSQIINEKSQMNKVFNSISKDQVCLVFR